MNHSKEGMRTSSSRVDEPIRGADMSAICKILYFVRVKEEAQVSQRPTPDERRPSSHLRASLLVAAGQAQKRDS